MSVGKIDIHNRTTLPENIRPATFFREACQTFKYAGQTAGGHIDRYYIIGRHIVRLRFAGPSLMPFITPALEHLVTEPCLSPSLTVCLWDSVSTNTNMPPSPWSTDDYLARGEIRGYSNDCIRTAYHPGSGILSMIDTSLNIAVYWIKDVRQLPYYESGAPLRTILHWFLDNQKHQLVHAASVGSNKGGFLIAGKGGAGKSTTALACLTSELFYAGDDYVLLSIKPVPFVYSLYNTAKLNANDISKFPNLLPAIKNSEKLNTEKALFFLYNQYPEKVTKGFPVKAILLPLITGLHDTRFKKATPAASLTALAPSTIFQLPLAGHKAFQNLSTFVKQVPSYILEIGTDLNRIPDVILDLL